MQELTDTELLRQYVRQNSEAAFSELVTRYVPLVYSAALRKTGNPSVAEDVTQAVFIILARKARKLRPETALAGWLYQAARLTAANFLRTEIRRAHREQEAIVQSHSNETDPETWRQIMPLLEDGMGRLGERERNAVVLRFFEGKSFQEVGMAVGVSENAAKKRVVHALEKLRKFFLKRGVNSTAAAIGETISANSVHAAPAGLAKVVSATALAKGAVASTSALTLIKGALKIVAWTKTKTVIVVGLAILIAGGVGIFFLRATKKAANAFEAEGYFLYKGSQKIHPFEAFVRGDQWLIRTPINTNGILYHEESFDGKCVYTYMQFDGRGANVANSSAGTVERDDVPPVTSLVVPIWLAYGASRFFDSVTGTEIRPFLIASGLRHDRDHLLKAEWRRSTKPPFVPAYIYCPEINYRYRVVAFTNFNELSVPKEFVFETFPRGVSLTNSPNYFVHGFLTKITKLKGNENFQPVIDGHTFIADWRFPRAELLGMPANYVNTSKQWFSTNSPQWLSLSKLWDSKNGNLVWPRNGANISGVEP